MRKLGLSLLVSVAVALPAAAWSQDGPPSATADDFVCAFAGDCGEEDADEPGEETASGPRPRVSATRGFSLSTTGTPARRPAANRPRRPAASTAPRQGVQAAAPRRPAAASGQRMNLSLTFETGSARLTAAAVAQARVFGEALLLPQLANMRFRIEGHTDAVGSRASNVALSQRRAQSVADFLVAMGVPRSRIEVQGYGPDRPLPGTSRASQQNRRVEAVRIS